MDDGASQRRISAPLRLGQKSEGQRTRQPRFRG